MNDSQALTRLEQVLTRLEGLLTVPTASLPAWNSVAYRWYRKLGRMEGGCLQPVHRLDPIRLDDLLCIDRQKEVLLRNTQQFVAGLPANNALLWGARGTGKSTLVKALVNEFSPQGLRVIEVEAPSLMDLPNVVALLQERSERFLIFTDDLSFDADDSSYRALKAMLDGSIEATPANVLLYATSNRRHLIPEFMEDNLSAKRVDGEIHPGEAVEEKISLSERFGLWLSFYPFKQAEYLQLVNHWLQRLGYEADLNASEIEQAALQWALQRGSRSGRVANQFARDWVGQATLSAALHSPD